MNKRLSLATLLGGISVILGAFGAHALKAKLSAHQLESFEVAVRYQMYHALILVAINLYTGFSETTKRIISGFFFAGIICFSGSIYAITSGIDASNIWFITPLGGLLFILGWLYSSYSFLKK